ncbi:Epididymal protein 13 [Apodemus speciosus]|uniref:Epididymal protein 13 n=1 Tax=Apodemus speciosus TaxID=105296 RepID=A0ABQ0EXL7_APOSI
MCRLEPFLKRSLVVLLFLGLAEACVPRDEKRLMSRLSTDVLKRILEETSNCKEEECAYMVITFFFVSYNKGDWCYCHYCNPDLDLR